MPRPDLPDLKGNINQIVLRSLLLSDRPSAQPPAAHSLPVGFQRPFRARPRHTAVGPAGPAFRLQKEALINGFKNRFLFSACRDQKLLHILPVVLQHRKSPVESPVRILCQDPRKAIAVKKVNCQLKIPVRKLKKISLAANIGKKGIRLFIHETVRVL